MTRNDFAEKSDRTEQEISDAFATASVDWIITKYGSGSELIEVLLLNEPMEGVLLGAISSPLVY